MQRSLGSVGLPRPLWLPSHTLLEAHRARHIFSSQRKSRSSEAGTKSHRWSQEEPSFSFASPQEKQKYPDAGRHSFRITGIYQNLLPFIYWLKIALFVLIHSSFVIYINVSELEAYTGEDEENKGDTFRGSLGPKKNYKMGPEENNI